MKTSHILLGAALVGGAFYYWHRRGRPSPTQLLADARDQAARIWHGDAERPPKQQPTDTPPIAPSTEDVFAEPDGQASRLTRPQDNASLYAPVNQQGFTNLRTSDLGWSYSSNA